MRTHLKVFIHRFRNIGDQHQVNLFQVSSKCKAEDKDPGQDEFQLPGKLARVKERSKARKKIVYEVGRSGHIRT